ncbi:ATP-binding cassette domain-containing protein [Levilactobacillus yonginensis]|uniref:ATP-binding cassette domain-containing protein n=1 Tax=Levilactobacillus yonginensis TaxID=1054041 RepID=UPI00345D7702
MTLIQLSMISKTIRRQPVLRDVSFTVEQQSITTLEGINGSGKTLVLKAMLGLVKTRGRVTVNDIPLRTGQRYPVQAGILIEAPGFIEEFSAYKNLKLLANLMPGVTNQDIVQLLHQFQLPRDNGAKVKHFSLGMKQKLGIAQATLGQSELIVLDEPTNALDTESVVALITYLQSLKAAGSTLVVASHDHEFVSAISDKRILVEAGTAYEV